MAKKCTKDGKKEGIPIRYALGEHLCIPVPKASYARRILAISKLHLVKANILQSREKMLGYQFLRLWSHYGVKLIDFTPLCDQCLRPGALRPGALLPGALRHFSLLDPRLSIESHKKPYLINVYNFFWDFGFHIIRSSTL